MKTALVLQGGGYKGVYQYGVLKTIRQKYDEIYGTSVGALNGLYVASNYPIAIERIWEKVINEEFRFHTKHWYNYPLMIMGKRLGAYDNKLDKELEKIIDGISEIKPFYVTCVDYYSGNIYYVRLEKTQGTYEERWFKRNGKFDDKPEIKASNAYRIAQIIVASTAVPGAFEPTKLDGKMLFDGGVRDIAPLNGAVINGASDITLVLCSPGEPRKLTKIENTLRAVTRTIDILTNEVAVEDIRKFHEYNELAKRHPEFNADLKEINIKIYKPEFPLLDDSLNPDKKSLLVAFNMGVKHAKEVGSANMKQHKMNDK